MGAVIAAAALAADRRLIRRLRDAGATSPATATDLQATRGLDKRRIARLERRGVLVRAGANRFYLDETAHAAWEAKRRLLALIVLALAFAVLAVVAYLQWSQAR